MESVLKKRKNISLGMQIDNLFKSNNVKKITLFNKLIFQIMFCIVLLGSVWLYKMVNPLSFEHYKNKYEWILRYNMTYENTYNGIANYLNNKFQFNIPLKDIVVNLSLINPVVNSNENTIKNIAVEQKNEIINEVPLKEIEGYNNMQIIAEEIKNKYTLIQPSKGKITCPFGNRESDNQDISTFHLGIDIGNVLGTKIVAALEGTVVEVSKNSVYGNYIKIQKDDILIIYAHLNKTLVKKGDKINQGDNIGEMGKTGLATGTHLHFEIRKNGVVINPEYLVNFN